MIIMKWIGKLAVIPIMLITSLMWLVAKVWVTIYGLCYGLLGLGVVAAMILFLAYQEWTNVLALVVIAIIAFTILFAGTFIQVLLEEINRRLAKVLRT